MWDSVILDMHVSHSNLIIIIHALYISLTTCISHYNAEGMSDCVHACMYKYGTPLLSYYAANALCGVVISIYLVVKSIYCVVISICDMVISIYDVVM